MLLVCYNLFLALEILLQNSVDLSQIGNLLKLSYLLCVLPTADLLNLPYLLSAALQLQLVLLYSALFLNKLLIMSAILLTNLQKFHIANFLLIDQLILQYFIFLLDLLNLYFHLKYPNLSLPQPLYFLVVIGPLILHLQS